MLLKLIKKNQQQDTGKFYLCVKDPFESKYQMLIDGREKIGTKKLKNSKSFIDYQKQSMMSMKI